MEKQRLFTDTFRKYFDGWIAEIFIPKLSRAALYRAVICYVQMAADAAGILVYSFEIDQRNIGYRITINRDINITVKLPQKIQID